MMNSNSNNLRDTFINPVINSVMDGVLKVTGIDPCWIQPDSHFQADLELTAEQVMAIGKFASNYLNLDLTPHEEAVFYKAAHPRELVRMIESYLESRNHKKAG